MALYENQVPAESILDLNGRQTYLGNAFAAAAPVLTLTTQGLECPLMALKNPATNKKALFLTAQIASCLSASGNVLLNFYADPTIANSSINLPEVNCRIGSSTISVAQAVAGLIVGGTLEVQKITTVADVAKSLNSTYFLINSINPVLVQKAFYVWFDVAGTGVDPAVAGKTGVKVSIAENDDANTVAAAVQTALNALTNDFTSTVSTNEVTVTNVNAGLVTAAIDGTATTGFTFAVLTSGAVNYGNNVGSMVTVLGTVMNKNLIIIEPGKAVLITATGSADGLKALASMCWYEI